MNRKDFIINSAILGLSFHNIFDSIAFKDKSSNVIEVNKWHGFNLYDFYFDNKYEAVNELDYEFMAEWGFNFVRLPLNYWHWADKSNPFLINENFFRELDRAISLAQQYKIHTCINLHRIPGYCINRGQLETLKLFTYNDQTREKAIDAASFNWKYIAERYKNISDNDLSFNLINEPANMNEGLYIKVIDPIIKTIKKISPDRLILVDGINLGKSPIKNISKDIVQCTRGYAPGLVTHFNSSELRKLSSPKVLTWPVQINNELWNKERLKKEFNPWRMINQQGVNVFIGEFGVLNTVPHDITLAFLKDQLSIWKDYNWGWAMWNLRGAFGVMNSNRKDVKYENYKGMKLDREMLELLLRFK